MIVLNKHTKSLEIYCHNLSSNKKNNLVIFYIVNEVGHIRIVLV